MALAKRLYEIAQEYHIHDIFLKKKHSRDPILVKASSGAATIFIGAIVTKKGETAGTPEVDLCQKGEPVAGIITGEAWAATNLNRDSDNPFPDGTYLWMEEIEDGDEFLAVEKTNTGFAYQDRVQADGGYVIPFAYLDNTEATDTLESVIGKAQEVVTAAGATEHYFLVKGGAM